MADAAHPPHGRRGFRLSTRRHHVPRHRRPPIPRGVPPQGAVRRRHHPARRSQLRRGAPGPGPAATVPLRPAEGHRAVRLRPSPRHCSDPDAQRMGAAADGEVLHQQRSPRLLRCRGVQGRPRKTGPSPLAQILVGRQHVPHAGGRERPRQPRRKAFHRITGAEAGVAAPSRADGAGCAGLRGQPVGEADARPHHRPPDDPPRAPCPLARRLRGTGQPDDAQPREHLGPCRTTRDNGATFATRCPPRAFATSPTGTAPSFRPRRAYGARPSPPTNRAGDGTWDTASRRGRGRRSTPTASRGSCRSWRPRPGPTPTASWSGPSPPPGPTEAYNWGDSAIAPDAVGRMTAQGLRIPFYFEYELRARHPQGSHCPPETLHALLPFQRAGGGPAAVPRHPVRRGHRGGRGNLRERRVPHDSYDRAHPRVLRARPVTHGDTGKIMASTVGTGVPPTGVVRAESLPLGQSLPPDASSSCRGE